MTSLELVKFINSERAEGETELRHSDFLTKVPKVLGEIGERNFRFTYTDVQNKERPCYNFPKREACLMAMSYSYELQAKVYDKMTALEEGSFSVPKTLAGALRLAADQQDVIVEQARKLALAAPAVAYIENFVKADGLIGIREAAKALGMQQNAFIHLLLENKVMFRENGGLQAYASSITKGYFKVKQTQDTKGKVRTQTMFTPKGLRWVCDELELSKLLGI
jgi:phage antirepressor YoqD-like protein